MRGSLLWEVVCAEMGDEEHSNGGHELALEARLCARVVFPLEVGRGKRSRGLGLAIFDAGSLYDDAKLLLLGEPGGVLVHVKVGVEVGVGVRVGVGSLARGGEIDAGDFVVATVVGDEGVGAVTGDGDTEG